MNVSEKCRIAATLFCSICQLVKSHGHAIIVTMCHQYLISFNVDHIFSWKIGEKIIISGYNAAGTVCEGFDIKFSAFHVSTMHQHVKRSFPVYCDLQVFISSVGIAHDQHLHTSSSFIRRRAFPRWLILFFSSMESSAEVQPYSGR